MRSARRLMLGSDSGRMPHPKAQVISEIFAVTAKRNPTAAAGSEGLTTDLAYSRMRALAPCSWPPAPTFETDR
jgi:hypothetical protein